MILDRRDFVPFQVLQHSVNGRTFLAIEGNCTHSALAFWKLECVHHENRLLIYPFVAKARTNPEAKYSNFVESIEIPPDVNVVHFGSSEQVIWTRMKS